MKLLIATDNYPPRIDGISTFLTEIIPALKQEHDVHVIAPNYGESNYDEYATKIPIKRLQIGDYHPAKLKPLTIFSQVKQADAVFLQTLGSIGALALLAARIQKKPVVLYTHSIEWELVPNSSQKPFLKRILPGIIKKIDKLLYSWIDLLLLPSESISELYYWNKIENKREIVQLGVDTKKFSPITDTQLLRNTHGLDTDTFVVGYHGRLAREKDLKTLLRAYIRFSKKYADKKTTLLIVGDGLPEIRQLFDRDDVIVTGFVTNPQEYLRLMDVYVMPSTTETTSLAVLEAMSSQLPVISTPVGFVNDYITHEQNGMLFEEKNEYQLSRYIEDLYTDSSKRKRIAKNARNYVSKHFDWKNTREKIVDVFSRLV